VAKPGHASLITAPSAMWSLGGDLLQPILMADEIAPTWRSAAPLTTNRSPTIVRACWSISAGGGWALRSGAVESGGKTQKAAVADSRRALDIANDRYVGGLTTYLDVITAQSTLLSNERLATQLLGQQMTTSVYLVKALGGAWDASEIRREQVKPALVQAVQP